MPVGMRLSSFAKQGLGTLGMLAGIALGCGITYFANRTLDRAKLDGINATPVMTKPSECSPKTAGAYPAGGLARNDLNPAQTHRAAAAAKETDLVRAVARGLSKPESPAQTNRAPGEHAR